MRVTTAGILTAVDNMLLMLPLLLLSPLWLLIMTGMLPHDAAHICSCAF